MARYKPNKMQIPSLDGLREVAPSSRQAASLIGRYWNDIKQFRQTGNSQSLRKYAGVTIATRQGRVALITDPDLLAELDAAGELDIDDPYQ